MAKVTRSEHLIDIACESAYEFLDVLSPVSGAFASGVIPDRFMFRGVRSASFALVPSAFRNDAELLLNGQYVRPPISDLFLQCAAEIQTLKRFFEIAARHGVRLPEDSPLLRSRLEEWELLGPLRHSTSGHAVVWPPPEFYSLIALAQHYGVPTRALDWTTSSLTAAYFAAANAQVDSAERLVVWVLNRSLERMGRIASPATRQRELVVFTAPGADNENLRAQRGMFMLQLHELRDPQQPFVVKPLDEVFVSELQAGRELGIFFRVTLEARESRAVLAGLAAANVTAGALFPGLWGVARELREERLLLESPRRTPRSNTSKEVAARVTELMKAVGA